MGILGRRNRYPLWKIRRVISFGPDPNKLISEGGNVNE